jgi:hypothetical protein
LITTKSRNEIEVVKRVARELNLGDPVEQNRHFEREALNPHMRAFAVWRCDDVPIFYWCAEGWLERVEGAVRRDQAGL